MKMENLQDLLVENVQDLYSAESQAIKNMPKLEKAATSKELKSAFNTHLKETENQVKRLEQIAKIMGVKTEGKKCKGMEGLIAEAQELIDDKPDEEVLDAGLIAAAQKMEHYEIAGYGTARTYAQLLGQTEVMDLLQETLDEESATDEKLTTLAESGINLAAAQ